MNIGVISTSQAEQSSAGRTLESLGDSRKRQENFPSSAQVEKKQVQPEEMLQQIKALTEDGLYSVRFENDSDLGDLVVKVVDQKTHEVIRQIPPEELLNLTQRLEDLRGNIVDTEG
jgi:flagellar protein FlaG